MTGTIIGGYANHLYPTLFRICGDSLRAEGFEWGKDLAFSEAYGRIDRIITTKETGVEANVGRDVTSMRKAITGRSTERKAVRPGIMPTLFGRHMMGSSLFITLDQMSESLPEFHEYFGGPVASDQIDDPFWVDTACTMLPAQQAESDRVTGKLHQTIKELMKSGEHMKLLASYLWTSLEYPDRPFGWGHSDELADAYEEYSDQIAAKAGEAARSLVRIPHTVGYWNLPGTRKFTNWIGVVTPRDCDRATVYPKEAKLIEICKMQKAAGVQTWVYVQMTNKRDIQSRLARLLESEGFRVGILRSKDVAPRDREAWIEKHGMKYDVMISHPQLVSTGLELFSPRDGGHNYSAIVFYQVGYSAFVMMQGSRRAWRIGQSKVCRVYYLYYLGTMQEHALKLMSLKMAASRSLEGQFSEEGLTAMCGGANIQMELARGLADKMDAGDIRRKWDRTTDRHRVAAR